MSGIDDELDAILKDGRQDQGTAGAVPGPGPATTTIVIAGPTLPNAAPETPVPQATPAPSVLVTPAIEKTKGVEDAVAGNRRKKAKTQPEASPAATNMDKDEDEDEVGAEDEHLAAVRATYPGLAEAALLELAAGRRRLAEHAAHTASEE